MNSCDSGNSQPIDVSELIYMPLPVLEDLLANLDMTLPGNLFVVRVIRRVAFYLLLGAVKPCPKLDRYESVQRGANMLEVLGRVLPTFEPD